MYRTTKERRTCICSQLALIFINAPVRIDSLMSAAKVLKSERFEIIYTPKKTSWLNMAEIELASFSKQCLDRRIGDIETFSKEVYGWAMQRDLKKTGISWQFTKSEARKKIKRHYTSIKN
ncbi:hypothetical protein ACFL42_00970 [Candidatus Omnitrophota bacterium]